VNAGAEQGLDVLGRAREIEGLIGVELRRRRGIDAVPTGLEIRNG
jgi:hypothetical protein